MKRIYEELKIVIENVIIAIVVSTLLYYLLVWIVPQKSLLSVEESKLFVFWLMFGWGTLLACVGVYRSFKEEAEKLNKKGKK